MSSSVLHTTKTGESYARILHYFFPELITALVLYSLLNLFDAKLIADLQKTALYAALGVTSTLVHFITKVAEGLSVGTIVLCGHYNGRNNLPHVGIAAISSFWTTAFIGILISGFLYMGAPLIYAWYGIPEHMITLSVPFLRLRAVGIFFMFLYFSCIGFLRGIKNTRMPMVFFVLGAIVFMFLDWSLVYGRCGFESYGLEGSSWAFLWQHVVMFAGAMSYMLFNKETRKYGMSLLKSFRPKESHEIVSLSWPVMIDKATLAFAKMWLVMLIAPAGEIALGTFAAIKDIAQLAFVPGLAFAQVITLIVSNDAGAGNWSGVKNDIKRVFLLALLWVGSILFIFSIFAYPIIGIFDKAGTFTHFAARAFPIVSALTLFDLLQLVLAAALRGAGDVRTVMKIRLLTALFFFLPFSWIIAKLPIDHTFIKFMLIYGSYYLSDGLMSLLYVRHLSGKEWQLKLNGQEKS